MIQHEMEPAELEYLLDMSARTPYWVCKALFCDVNPMPVKYAMQMRGFPVGDCRLPLTTLNEDHKRNVREAMTSFAATLTEEEIDHVI